MRGMMVELVNILTIDLKVRMTLVRTRQNEFYDIGFKAIMKTLKSTLLYNLVKILK
jgi:hypothetical protein